ncbi:hypothetical protein SAMN04490239_0773 [Rhodococcus koreensis]|uniref:Uncharacterized protein n=1 Tax=Rhodococcus koreensis TaxID=99653 RepID=A0A1H4IHT7_9NOCA|nr:hypothetical protein SAMN04490239_0773 [Rhodococcus koreensis]
MSRPWEQIALFDLHQPSAPDPDTVEATEIDAEQTAAQEPPTPTADAESPPPTAAAEPAESPTVSAPEPATASGRPVWESLPVGVEADEHAVIVTAAGTYTPSGRELTGPVDSVEKLDKLVRWAALTPLGSPPQVWIVGQGACEALGWVIDPGSEDDFDDMEALRTRAAADLTAVLQATLTPMLTAGWELRGDPGHVVHLSRSIGKFTSMVDVVLEPYVWTYWNKDFGWNNRVGEMGILGSPTAGTYLPDEDLPAARELGRRLAWCAKHLGVLPGPTPARTGAAIVDKIKRGDIVNTCGRVSFRRPPLRCFRAQPPRCWG